MLIGGRNVILLRSCLFIRAESDHCLALSTRSLSSVWGSRRLQEGVGMESFSPFVNSFYRSHKLYIFYKRNKQVGDCRGTKECIFAFLFPCICLENYHILLIKKQVGRCQRTQECNFLAPFNYFCICLNSNHVFLIKEASRLEIVGGRRNAIKEEKTSAVAEIAHYHPSLHQLYQHIIPNSACSP